MQENQNATPLPTDSNGSISPAALAKRWDCCRQSIYNMIHDDELHSFKVRARRLIPMSEVHRIERGEP